MYPPPGPPPPGPYGQRPYGQQSRYGPAYPRQAYPSPPPPEPVWPRKNRWLHALASFFFPGLGTILADRQKRGIRFMLAFYLLVPALMGVAFAVVFGLHLPDQAVVVLPALLLVWEGIRIAAVVDGFRSAAHYNRVHPVA